MPKDIKVHGLIIDPKTGKLDIIVNGYEKQQKTIIIKMLYNQIVTLTLFNWNKFIGGLIDDIPELKERLIDVSESKSHK